MRTPLNQRHTPLRPFVSGAILFIWMLHATTAAEPPFRADRVLVKAKPGADLAGVNALLGATALRTYPAIGNLKVMTLPADVTVADAITLYQLSGLVVYAEPDYIVSAVRTPDDFRYWDGSLWGLNNTGQLGGTADADIDAPEAWDIQATADNVVVAVIDTGARLTHEDLAANLWVNPGEAGTDFLGRDKATNLIDDDDNGYVDDVHGINAILGTGAPLDDHGHGTHVSGTIGGVGDNRVGVTGVAWRVRLMELKFLNALAEGSISDAIECIDYARNKGARIINASWGGYDYTSNALRDAIASVRDAGMIFCAATGNDGSNNDTRPLYPASYDLDNIIAVAATTRRDELAFFSNHGAATVDLGAPGADILSSWNTSDDAYKYSSGTSMASPHVAGASALVWARFSGENYRQIISRILSSVDPIPMLAGKSVTGGRLNVYKALGSSSSPSPSVTVTGTDDIAGEAGPDPGRITISRTGSTSSSLTVQIVLGGTARNGVDYQALPASVTIDAGASSVTITVTPVDDGEFEGNETVTLSLAPDPMYQVGSPSRATVVINDNDLITGLPPFFGSMSVQSANGSGGIALASPPSTGSNGFMYRLTGQPGRDYVIETSSDLASWTPLSTNTVPSSGYVDVTDSSAGAMPKRFYRATSPGIVAIQPGQGAGSLAAARSDRILVRPVPGADLRPLNQLLGGLVIRTFPAIGNLQVLQLPATLPVKDALKACRASPLVAYAEADFLVHALATPNDFRFFDGSLWGLHNTGQLGGTPDADIDGPEAWDLRTDASSIVVALTDTGVRATHEDLAANLWTNPGEIPGNGIDDDSNGYVDDVHGVNVLTGTGNPADDYGHGTHVSGVVGGVGNNNVGVVGVNWRVQIMAVKFLDAQGNGAISDAVTAIDYARAKGARIINASWGSTTFMSTALQDAIASARDAGILFVAAAGNSAGDNDANPLFPASYGLDNIIAVAATDRNDNLAFFGNYGASTVDLGAPGHDVFSCWDDSDSSYQFFSGSSVAAGFVSGAAALAMAQHPGEGFAAIKQRILSGADPIPALQGRTVTGGRLNLLNAVSGGQPPPPPPGLPVISLSELDPSASETGPNTGGIRFHRTGDTSQPIQVNWTFSGTAQNGADFQELPTTSLFPAGQSEADLTIVPIDDSLAEGDETVTVTLAPGPDYVIGPSSSATVTIADNDQPPPPLPTVTVTASDPNASESGPDTGTFTISRTGSTNSPLTVNYTLNGSASNGSDYQSLSGSATLPAGAASTTVTVTPINDSAVETSETVILSLSAGAAYTVGSPSSATVTIADNDQPPPLVADFTTSVLLGIVPLVVEFTDTSTGNPVSWNWNFGDGTTSPARHPTHIYLVPGNYTVTLTVRDSTGATSSKSVVIRATLL